MSTLTDNTSQVCIVGLGPAGLGAALTLSKSMISSHVLCLEQGDLAVDRACSALQNDICKREEPCQTIAGFGGSSLLSGGKVSSFPAGGGLATILGSSDLAEKKLEQSIKVLNTYLSMQKHKEKQADIAQAAEFFTTLGFEYKYYDVYEFHPADLKNTCANLHSLLESRGMTFLLNTRLIDVDREGHGFRLTVLKGSKIFSFLTKYLVLGVGRSGQSTVKQLNTKLNLGAKDDKLDVGVRLELPKMLLPKLSWHHRDLKLLFKDARTFCVCEVGRIAPYIIDGVCYADGNHNPSNKGEYTNLGIIIRLKPTSQNRTVLDDIRQIALKHRNGRLVCQKLSSYLDKTPRVLGAFVPPTDALSFWDWGNVDDCFPPSVSAIVKQSVLYFAEKLIPMEKWREVTVFAPEVEYTGVSLPVNSDFSISPGIFIIGDCTGQFRGIGQAFCSGVICAEKLLEKSHHDKNRKE